MNEMLLIKIKTSNKECFFKYILKENIKLQNINYQQEFIIASINKNDLAKLKRFYQITIIKDYSKTNIYPFFKKNLIKIISFMWMIIIFFFLRKIIIKINKKKNNKELNKVLTKELENYQIKRLTFKKSYPELQNIKEIIKNKLNSQLEWLEIENIGMTYNIKLEMRKSKEIKVNAEHCNVIAQKDGVITKIKSNKGIVLVKNNQFIKENALLITGSITLNDEVTIDIPKLTEEKVYSNKTKNNLLLEIDNRDRKIFKSRFQNYDTISKPIFSLLGKKLFLLKEYEYTFQ